MGEVKSGESREVPHLEQYASVHRHYPAKLKKLHGKGLKQSLQNRY